MMSDEELEAVLKSEVIFHEDVYDLIHTLESYDSGKYQRTAHDALHVIRRLMAEYRRLRDCED